MISDDARRLSVMVSQYRGDQYNVLKDAYDSHIVSRIPGHSHSNLGCTSSLDPRDQMLAAIGKLVCTILQGVKGYAEAFARGCFDGEAVH